MPWNGINFHILGVLEERGQGEGAIALVYLPLAVGSFSMALLYGALFDRIPTTKKLLALVPPLLFMVVSLLAISLTQRRWHVAIFGAALGAFQGSASCAFAVLPAALFGRRELGSIQASVYVTAQLASAGGAVALGFAIDYFGSFVPLFVGFVAVELALVALFVVRAMATGARCPCSYRATTHYTVGLGKG